MLAVRTAWTGMFAPDADTGAVGPKSGCYGADSACTVGAMGFDVGAADGLDT